MFYNWDCSFFPAGLIEQRDSQPLLKLIESIGDWPVASEDWNTTTGTNHTLINASCLFYTNKHVCTCNTAHKQVLFFLKNITQSLCSYICSQWIAAYKLCWWDQEAGRGFSVEQSGVGFGRVMRGQKSKSSIRTVKDALNSPLFLVLLALATLIKCNHGWWLKQN